MCVQNAKYSLESTKVVQR